MISSLHLNVKIVICVYRWIALLVCNLTELHLVALIPWFRYYFFHSLILGEVDPASSFCDSVYNLSFLFAVPAFPGTDNRAAICSP